ncbi:MAG: hypothetical protein Q7S45_02130 [Candidatus Curtissbacteria bacterium]|nr:hypothetical protein [Candidatus Curtissbacteria bacterium]
MGTTKIKIIDLSSENQSVKASQKHAQNFASVNKIKKGKEPEKSSKPENANTVIASDLPAGEAGAKQSDQEEIASSQAPRNDSEEKTSKPKAQIKSKAPKAQKHHLGKKYLESLAKVEKGKLYPAAEALELLAKTSYTKFDPSVEIHLGINVKSLRGSVNFPHSVGPVKEKRYLVFAEKNPPAGGADTKNIIWADADTIAEIESGKLKPNRDFSIVIASPKFMPHLAKVAKILGPAGMMPNPKTGTITENPTKAIEENTGSGSEYRTDPTAPIIHAKIGKLSEKSDNLKENLRALVLAVGPQKIKKATITSTMSPGIKIDVSTL